MGMEDKLKAEEIENLDFEKYGEQYSERGLWENGSTPEVVEMV